MGHRQVRVLPGVSPPNTVRIRTLLNNHESDVLTQRAATAPDDRVDPSCAS